jgi:hypothetical protein
MEQPTHDHSYEQVIDGIEGAVRKSHPAHAFVEVNEGNAFHPA